jgi:hypothetical protein
LAFDIPCRTARINLNYGILVWAQVEACTYSGAKAKEGEKKRKELA